ncbi:hypothetical protein GCM10008905_10940 [Clostridium malenominatum]|uniref:Uncharacterized protein n=1 Tax=Clostridium malenominatum TaxID=1539 RepID=A0ABP3U2K4_9CLOT
MIKLEHINIVVFWGAVWGIVETMIGHLIHLISFDIGRHIWFPLAFYFLYKVYTQTKRKEAVLYVAFIVSGIKLMNLFMETSLDRALNPIATIISEALAMIVICKILEKAENDFNLFGILAVNCIWRIIYTTYLLLMPVSYIFSSHLRDIGPSVKFFFIDNLASTLVAFISLVIVKKLCENKEEKNLNIPPTPIVSFSILVLAFIIKWFI